MRKPAVRAEILPFAVSSMATALNIPITLWRDDTRQPYGGTENPLVMSMSSNQSIYKNTIPLSMFGGAGNPFPTVNLKQEFAYLNSVALPVQKVFQEI